MDSRRLRTGRPPGGRVLDEFVTHYHLERNHQGLGHELIVPETRPLRGTRVRCRERLGGLLRYYHRAG